MLKRNNKVKIFESERKIQYVFILFSVFLILLFITVKTTLFSDPITKSSIDNALIKIKEREVYLQNFFQKTEQKLIAIRESSFFNDYLQGTDPDTLEKIFLSISKSDLDIMQIRYLDANGIEKVRVEKHQYSGQYHIVPKEELQDKSERYYFYKSKEMPLEKVWFSKIDLNIEHKKVEVPYKPTVRAMLPIQKDGKFSGILIINYFMKDVLKAFLDMPFYNTILCNAEGYTMMHYNPELNWGEHQTPKINLKNMPQYMEHYNDISSRVIFRSEDFVSAKLRVPTMEGAMIMIIEVKPLYVEYQKHQLILEYLMITYITIMLSLFASLAASKIVRKLAKELRDSKEYIKLLDKNIILFSIDLNGKITKASTAFYEISKYSKKELLDKPYSALIHPDQDENVFDAISEHISKGMVWRGDMKMLSKDGKPYWLDMTIYPVYNEKGKILTYTAICHHIEDKTG